MLRQRGEDRLRGKQIDECEANAVSAMTSERPKAALRERRMRATVLN
jgi:hypothetical protein